MRIIFSKISDVRHELRIVRVNGDTESVVCETRSTLVHDFLHFVVEQRAKLEGGFWGNLAKGKTLAEMNDRTGASMAAEAPALMDIERIVGALSGAAKGHPAGEAVRGITRYLSALEATAPEWLTEDFVLSVQERLASVLGRWKATPYGASMELVW
jgi:hypothetical protein